MTMQTFPEKHYRSGSKGQREEDEFLPPATRQKGFVAESFRFRFAKFISVSWLTAELTWWVTRIRQTSGFKSRLSEMHKTL